MASILLKNIEISLDNRIKRLLNWLLPLNWNFTKFALHLPGLCLFFLFNLSYSRAQTNPTESVASFDYNSLDLALQKYWKLDQPQDEAEWEKWWLAAQAKR